MKLLFLAIFAATITAEKLSESNVQINEEDENLTEMYILMKYLLTRDVIMIRDFIVRLPYMTRDIAGKVVIDFSEIGSTVLKTINELTPKSSMMGARGDNFDLIFDANNMTNLNLVPPIEDNEWGSGHGIKEFIAFAEDTIFLHIDSLLKYVQYTADLSAENKGRISGDFLKVFTTASGVMKDIIKRRNY